MAGPNTPWVDSSAANFSANRADELQLIIEDLRDALAPENLRGAPHGNTPDWARKGLSYTQPGKTPFVQPSLYSNYQYRDVLANQLRAASHEQAIARAAAALNSPYQPPTQRPPRVPGTGRVPGAPARPSAAAINPAMLAAIELLLYAGDTNTGEQEALDKIYGPAVKPPAQTNVPNDAALMQLFQFMGQ